MPRAYRNAASSLNPTSTPQSQPIPGRNMIANNAGGYGFEISKWDQLHRFLILGSEGGTYYVTEQKLTLDNAKNVVKCIAEDGKRVVDTVVAVSDAGRAAKNDPALFVLAMAASAEDAQTRKYALDNLSKVARTGTHLFHFVSFVDTMRGWSRQLRNAVSSWYLTRSNDSLANQLAKYQSRDGWSHRDVLRLAHPVAETPAQLLAFRWAVGRFHAQMDTDSKYHNPEQYEADLKSLHELLPMIGAFEDLKTTTDEKKIVQLVTDFRLPLEMVPTEKRSKAVYEAVLPNLGITALIRQLPTLTRNGLLDIGSDNARTVSNRITDANELKKGRVHPIAALLAHATYAGGHSAKGSSSWTPNQRIVDALDEAFYLSFGVIEPTGKRIFLALDVSGSMGWVGILGNEILKPCQITAAMSMVVKRTESESFVMGFSTNIVDLGISPKMRLNEVMHRVQMNNFGGTDCAAAINYAADHKIAVDAFQVYTDSETWAGTRNHPVQALKQYQQKMGIPAKLISVATSSTNVSIADETPFTMNVCGFDTAAPNLMADFIRG